MNRARWMCLAAIGAPLLVHPRVSLAEDKEAETLYREGRAALEAKAYDEACAKIARSQALEPLLPKLAFLAVCHEKQGKTAAAFREYLEVAEAARKAGLTEREAKARELADQLAPSLLRVRFVRIAPRSDETITCNGEPLPERSFDGSIPLDPGMYACKVAAPGHTSWSTTFVLDQVHRDVTVTVVPLDATDGQTEPAATSKQLPPAKRAVLPSRHQTINPLPFYIGGGAAFAVGVVGAVLGIDYGVRALDKKAQSDALCEGGCLQRGVDAMDDARNELLCLDGRFLGRRRRPRHWNRVDRLGRHAPPRARDREGEPDLPPRGARMERRRGAVVVGCEHRSRAQDRSPSSASPRRFSSR